MTNKRFLPLCLCLTLLFASCGSNGGSLDYSDAADNLSALLKGMKVNVTTVSDPVVDISGSNLSAAAELPSLEKYPLSVVGSGGLHAEIVSSTEKSGSGNDGWLNEVAEAFNREFAGQYSVSIRPIASGLAKDYISAGVYVPDGFTPSNELWGAMLEADGVRFNVIDSCLVKNTAGILMKKKTASEIGEITLGKVLSLAESGSVTFGYTNPYVSSTGLNMLLGMLSEFDPTNPISDVAAQRLSALQGKLPPVAYTTAQMRQSAEKGLIDAMTMERQAFANTAALSDYIYKPFGVRHDSPLYSLTDDADTQDVMRAFAAFAKNSDNQARAKRMGFNHPDDESYKGTQFNLTGGAIYSAQQLFKENKTGGKPIAAVFVADVSGSMAGVRINSLREALVNGAQYISEEHYIGLVSYSSDITINLPVAPFNSLQQAKFIGESKSLAANGNTSTYEAVCVAADMLLKAKEQYPDAKLIMFVLSDGEANGSLSFARVKRVIGGLGIPVNTIGFEANLDELKQLSDVNEALSVNADKDDVVYQLKNIFNSQM